MVLSQSYWTRNICVGRSLLNSEQEVDKYDGFDDSGYDVGCRGNVWSIVSSMFNDNMGDLGTYKTYECLVERLSGILERNKCSRNVSRLLAENCASAERDAAYSHGLFRMKGYVSTLNAGGWVDGHAVPKVSDVAPGFIRIDAMNGFAVPALAAGRDLAAQKARTNGVAVIAIRNSHHLGALSLDVEPFAEQGLLAISFINSMKAVVPFGGRSAVFGTNPIAFASPRAGGAPPIVFDMATSVMAHGDVQVAAREGRQLDIGVGVDAKGEPTTDPNAVLAGGALAAFGGHKGSALCFMVEVMCAALVGGKFSNEVDLSKHPGATTPHTGQSVILIDQGMGRSALPDFTTRVEELLLSIKDAGQRRLPGDRRYAARELAKSRGIFVSHDMDMMLTEML